MKRSSGLEKSQGPEEIKLKRRKNKGPGPLKEKHRKKGTLRKGKNGKPVERFERPYAEGRAIRARHRGRQNEKKGE